MQCQRRNLHNCPSRNVSRDAVRNCELSRAQPAAVALSLRAARRGDPVEVENRRRALARRETLYERYVLNEKEKNMASIRRFSRVPKSAGPLEVLPWRSFRSRLLNRIARRRVTVTFVTVTSPRLFRSIRV